MIQASRYASLLPCEDPKLTREMAIRLRNGATLKFMTGGGSDKSRASYTSRVLVATEIDAFDVVGGTSREGTKWSQLLARLKSFPRRDPVTGCRRQAGVDANPLKSWIGNGG